MLSLKNLTVKFGGLLALNDVSFDVSEGEIVGLIGPNGAGKTTLLNVISGFLRPHHGELIYKGKDITGCKPHQVAQEGICRTFQKVELFGDGLVWEHLVEGCYLQKPRLFHELFNTHVARKQERSVHKRTKQIMEMLELTDFEDEKVKNLPYGLQRNVGLGMALGTMPKLLMLDEPVAGMNPTETAAMVGVLRRLTKNMVDTIILIEHDIRMVMSLCDKVVVLNYGVKIADGTPQEVKENQEVINAYLGVEEE